MKLRELLEEEDHPYKGKDSLYIIKLFRDKKISKQKAYDSLIKRIKYNSSVAMWGGVRANIVAISTIMKPNTVETFDDLINTIKKDAGLNKEKTLSVIDVEIKKIKNNKFPVQYIKKAGEQLRDKAKKLPKKELKL